MPAKNSLSYRKQRVVGHADRKKKDSEKIQANKKERMKGTRNETKIDSQT
jgi:hypothetical protein